MFQRETCKIDRVKAILLKEHCLTIVFITIENSMNTDNPNTELNWTGPIKSCRTNDMVMRAANVMQYHKIVAKQLNFNLNSFLASNT